jgi:hypothetical protein
MKKTLNLSIAMTFILLSSCETSRERLEDSTDTTEQTEITMDNPFKLTIEDIREEQLEIEKKLTELKNSDVERQSHDYNAFKPEIEIIELRVDSLRTYMSDFESASEAEREIIYDRYKIVWEKISEDIESITDRFDDLKVLDN